MVSRVGTSIYRFIPNVNNRSAIVSGESTVQTVIGPLSKLHDQINKMGAVRGGDSVYNEASNVIAKCRLDIRGVLDEKVQNIEENSEEENNRSNELKR